MFAREGDIIAFVNPITFDFTAGPEGWYPATSLLYDAPTCLYDSGSLWLEAHNNTNTFGFWCSPPVAVEKNRLYRLRCSAGSNAPAAVECPDIRLRLNALDYLLIPRLEAERDTIKMALGERERSEHFRLKLAKRLLERKRG